MKLVDLDGCSWAIEIGDVSDSHGQIMARGFNGAIAIR
jgi:hypothetical protein